MNRNTINGRSPLAVFLAIITILMACHAPGQDIVSSGSGSYSTRRPAPCKPLPETIYRSGGLKGAVPTNQWWSSLVWNTHAFMGHWLHTLVRLGINDPTVVADTPFFNVFVRDGKRSHAVFNHGSKPATVRFSDDVTITAKPSSLTTSQARP